MIEKYINMFHLSNRMNKKHIFIVLFLLFTLTFVSSWGNASMSYVSSSANTTPLYPNIELGTLVNYSANFTSSGAPEIDSCWLEINQTGLWINTTRINPPVTSPVACGFTNRTFNYTQKNIQWRIWANSSSNVKINSGVQNYDLNCVVPTDGMTITTSTKLCQGTYNINSSAAVSGIKFNAHNLVLDCNNAILYGNFSGFGIDYNFKNNGTIKNCNIYNYTAGIYASGTQNGSIINNYIENVTSGLFMRNNFNMTIYNNTFFKVRRPLAFTTQSNYMNITSNTFTFYDEPEVQGINNSIIDNLFFNSTQNEDVYDVGLRIYNSTDTLIKGNNLSWCGSTCLFVQSSNGTTIINNFFNGVSLTAKNSLQLPDYDEPMSAILISPLYKGFTGNSDELIINATNLSNGLYASRNTIINNNSFGDNIATYLKTEGDINTVHDITNYWFTSFTPTTLYHIQQKFYNNNNFNALNNSYNGGTVTKFISDNIQYTYATSNRRLLNVTIQKNYLQFKNINLTNNYSIEIYNLTRAKVFYGNGTITAFDYTGQITLGLNAGVNVTVINDYTDAPDANPTTCGDLRVNVFTNTGSYNIIFVLGGAFFILIIFLGIIGAKTFSDLGTNQDMTVNMGLIIGTLIALLLVGFCIVFLSMFYDSLCVSRMIPL